MTWNAGFRTPSEELRNFTNRVSELEAFQRILDLPLNARVPALMFYGVGGNGKTWLLHRLRRECPKSTPQAYLDLEPGCAGGARYHNDPAQAYFEIRRQFGEERKCPLFDVAYAVMREKQGLSQDVQQVGGTSKNQEDVGRLVRVARSVFIGMGGPLLTLADALAQEFKFDARLKDRLASSSVGKWLSGDKGAQDFLYLEDALPGDINKELPRRLLQDIRNWEPANDLARKAVVFVDTIEWLRTPRSSDAATLDRQQWLRDLHDPEPGLFLVMAGRDKLNWLQDLSDAPELQSPLEQHLVGGLSENDARTFLQNCGVVSPDLQDAVLKVSTAAQHKTTSEMGYHPFCLGLCTDLIWRSGGDLPPSSFELGTRQVTELCRRFLRSFGQDSTYEVWLKKLALTPRFTEKAARLAFSSEGGAEQDAAWRTLTTFSFFKSQPGDWYSLHEKMRTSLVEIQKMESGQHPSGGQWQEGHGWWHRHWSSQEELLDGSSGLAWYHWFQTDADGALEWWKKAARHEKKTGNLIRHAEMISWCEQLELQQMSADTLVELPAKLLPQIALEIRAASIWDVGANHQRAMGLCERAMAAFDRTKTPFANAFAQQSLGACMISMPGYRHSDRIAAVKLIEDSIEIITELDYPVIWASGMNDLGNLYRSMDDPDERRRESHIWKAIECINAALRVRSVELDDEDWAESMNNLGLCFWALPGMKPKNMKWALSYFNEALRVRTQDRFPALWASTQHNMGLVHTNFCFATRSNAEKTLHASSAVSCFEKALVVRSLEITSRQWASSMNSMGNALRQIHGPTREESLQKASDCFENACRVRKRTSLPRDWGATQKNWGNLMLDLYTEFGQVGAYEEAEVHLQNALSIYSEREDEKNARKVEGSLRRLHKAHAKFDSK